MVTAIIVLFVTVLASGLLVRVFPPADGRWLKIALAFSGAYLFTITIIHLLPEVLINSPDPQVVGYWILAGFFLQMVLELFSHGIEHGHIHPHKNHQHGRISSMPFLLLASLFIHSFLEGSILVDGAGHSHSHSHGQNQVHSSSTFYSVLIGIAIHHIPAAFALMSVLLERLGSFKKAFAWLLIFAVGAPLGIFFSNVILREGAFEGSLYT
ncbi:MAG: zinc/iron permease, partial [Sphingobacteriales bacterium]